MYELILFWTKIAKINEDCGSGYGTNKVERALAEYTAFCYHVFTVPLVPLGLQVYFSVTAIKNLDINELPSVVLCYIILSNY